MATVLNLDFMQTMARVVRDSYVSQALLCVLMIGFLKVVVASWRYVLCFYTSTGWMCVARCLLSLSLC